MINLALQNYLLLTITNHSMSIRDFWYSQIFWLFFLEKHFLR